MKKIILSAVLTLLTMTVAMAETNDRLYMNDFQVTPGENMKVDIILDNPSSKFIAFEFSLTLPDGLRIALNKKGKPDASLDEDRNEDHTMTTKDNGNGHYKFVCYSMGNSEFNGTEGALIHLTLEADAAMTDGVYTGKIEGIMLSTQDVDIYPADETFTILAGNATGISTISSQADGSAAVYDMQGRRLTEAPKGLYIVNGRKYVIK